MTLAYAKEKRCKQKKLHLFKIALEKEVKCFFFSFFSFREIGPNV